ncbi:c-type cytochrome [Thermus thermophilus]|uniref:c-type cytochrome n=1 Tax=Thermus thermophilus TaxID=274 RepID=UPI001FCC3BD7|nr:c-type cytochrome [Thermus thermophilus]
MKRARTFLAAAGLLALGLLPLVRGQAEALPPGPGRDLVLGKCQACHDLQYVVDSKGITRSQWEEVVESMKVMGLQLTPEEEEVLLNYLATYLGPNPPPPQEAEATEAEKPRSGEALYVAFCASCHGPKGEGQANLFPPLRENTVLKDPQYPILVLLYGLEGPIAVGDQTYQGIMPSFGHLSDEEIAALVNYLRTAFAGVKEEVGPEAVAALRQSPLSPAEVLKKRP